MAVSAAAGGDKLSQWRALGLDPDGLDLASGPRGARLSFARTAENPAQWREALAEANR